MSNEVKGRIESIEFDNELMERIAARPFDVQTRRELLYLLTTLPAALAAVVVWSVGLSLALGFLLIVVGLPLTIAIFAIFRRFAEVERRRLALVDPRPTSAVYRFSEHRNVFRRAIGSLGDQQSWKDVAWFVFLSTFGVIIAVLAICVWLVAAGWMLYPFFGWALPGDWTPVGWFFSSDMNFALSFLMIPFGVAMVVVASWTGAGASLLLSSVARVCLSTSEEDQLRGRVTELERTREASIAQQTTELSRIERDLHDGAQARLVALAMDLGMAEEKIGEDPEAAQKLVAQARDEAQRTLAELRDLVRGIGPQILRDRGLEAALLPLAARSPIPVEIKIDLSERPSERVEHVAYFVTSEALANAIKHSGAQKININAWQNGPWLYLRVSDNGSGRADADGSGLAGLRARVDSVDGRLIVDSPAGGPTIIDAWLPNK